MCAKGLSCIRQTVEQDGMVTRIPITKGNTRLGRLFFANDSLLFCKVNIIEWS
jgi:hypothetical protein